MKEMMNKRRKVGLRSLITFTYAIYDNKNYVIQHEKKETTKEGTCYINRYTVLMIDSSN